MEFKPTFDVSEDGSYLWLGTNKGELMEFDLLKGAQGLSDRRSNVHTSSVNAIFRCRHSLWTLDESGKCQVWLPENGEISMGNTPKTFRVVPRWTFAMAAGWRLWVGQGRSVQVYSPLQLCGDAFNVTTRPITLPQGKTVGNITCGTTLPTDKDRVFLGHDDGKVSIYSQRDCTCLDVVPINIYNIVTLAGVGEFLWAGFRTGMVYVYDTSVKPWRVCKDWDAHHKTKITHLLADQTSLWRAGVGMVLSVAEDGILKTWDALLMDDWLGTLTLYYANGQRMKCRNERRSIAHFGILMSWSAHGMPVQVNPQIWVEEVFLSITSWKTYLHPWMRRILLSSDFKNLWTWKTRK
jgi:hypothetical protein